MRTSVWQEEVVKRGFPASLWEQSVLRCNKEEKRFTIISTTIPVPPSKSNR